MWEIFFIMLLYTGFLYMIDKWYSEKKADCYKANSISSIIFLILLIFQYYLYNIPYLLIIVIVVSVYAVLGLISKRSIDEIIISLLLLLSLQSILLIMNKLENQYTLIWQYGLIVIIWYLSIIYMIIETKYFKIDEGWRRQISLYNQNYQLMLIIITASYNILIYILLYMVKTDSLLPCLIFSILLVLSSIGILKIIQSYLQIKYSLIVIDTMNKWQKESRDYMNVIRSQRHDFNFHLHAVVGLIENKEYEECRNYVSNMANDASMINDIMPIHDAVIGSMLYNMKENAKKKGIEIEYNITYDLEHVLCNAFEINKILGNLIQNAIDAINEDAEKQYGIKVSIMKRRGNSVIIVSNLYLGDKDKLLHAYDLGYSTKTAHEGIGLSMISRTVEKYGGRIYTEFDDDVVSFIVNVPNLVHFEEG